MDRLWAPWRSSYVVMAARHDEPECIFCAKLADDQDEPNYVVRREELCFALLNLYPYNNGHLLVAPNRHVGEVEELTDDEMVALFRLTRTMIGALRRAMNPDGFNVGVNLGRVAGAGVPGHFHIHVVPRWNGDTSFMPVLGDTKVISQSLEEAYRRLRAALL
ncbi:MAG: HIT domain-containing protein [Firmicutes bacterium]|nr:HIT domain-containing protein [Bacillota bacterium]